MSCFAARRYHPVHRVSPLGPIRRPVATPDPSRRRYPRSSPRWASRASPVTPKARGSKPTGPGAWERAAYSSPWGSAPMSTGTIAASGSFGREVEELAAIPPRDERAYIAVAARVLTGAEPAPRRGAVRARARARGHRGHDGRVAGGLLGSTRVAGGAVERARRCGGTAFGGADGGALAHGLRSFSRARRPGKRDYSPRPMIGQGLLTRPRSICGSGPRSCRRAPRRRRRAWRA